MSEHTWTLEEQKQHRKLWVKALRSGKYEQGRKVLHQNGLYCCLGVACVVAGETTVSMGDHGNLESFDSVKRFFGLQTDVGSYRATDRPGSCLTEDNDYGCADFDEIADLIEAEPPGLFTDARATGEGK